MDLQVERRRERGRWRNPLGFIDLWEREQDGDTGDQHLGRQETGELQEGEGSDDGKTWRRHGEIADLCQRSSGCFHTCMSWCALNHPFQPEVLNLVRFRWCERINRTRVRTKLSKARPLKIGGLGSKDSKRFNTLLPCQHS